MMKFAIWLFERVMEVLAATVIIMAVSGPSRTVSGGRVLEELFRTALIPLTFYFISGYLASCVYFGLISRSKRKYFPIIMGSLFTAHLLFFSFISSSWFEPQVVVTGLLTIVCVVVIHAVGQIVMKRNVELF
jgi:hypothetical protein